MEVSFDAEPWFQQATYDQLIDLRKIGFAGNYAADYVAEYIAQTNPEVKAVYDYCNKNDVGFEVYIDDDEAEVWIAADYAKKLLRQVTGED